MLFLHGRVRFLTPDRQYADRTSGAPSALIANGKHSADALKRSGAGRFSALTDHDVSEGGSAAPNGDPP